MLVLRRKAGEAIVLNGVITIHVLAVEGERVKLGISAPPEVVIVRSELLDNPGGMLPGPTGGAIGSGGPVPINRDHPRPFRENDRPYGERPYQPSQPERPYGERPYQPHQPYQPPSQPHQPNQPDRPFNERPYQPYQPPYQPYQPYQPERPYQDHDGGDDPDANDEDASSGQGGHSMDSFTSPGQYIPRRPYPAYGEENRPPAPASPADPFRYR